VPFSAACSACGVRACIDQNPQAEACATLTLPEKWI
jgi:hypothetical protein